MTIFEPGTVVLVRFPFTDLASTKKRPALVVSPNSFTKTYKDIVIVALTSQPQSADLSVVNWREAGLLKTTWFKPLIATVSARLVDRSLGQLSAGDRGRVGEVLRQLIDASLG